MVRRVPWARALLILCLAVGVAHAGPLEDKIAGVQTIAGAQAIQDEVLRGDARVAGFLATHLEGGTPGQQWLALRMAQKRKSLPPFAVLSFLFASPEQEIVDLSVQLALSGYPDDALEALLTFATPARDAAMARALTPEVAVRMARRVASARPEERVRVLSLLRKLQPLEARVLRELLPATLQPGVGAQAIALVQSAGKTGDDLLVAHAQGLLKERDASHAASFVENLVVLGDAGVVLMEPFFYSSSPQVCLALMDGLAAMTPEGRPVAFPAQWIESRDPQVQEKAIFLAARGRDPVALPNLHAVLASGTPLVRSMAAWAIGQIGDPSSEVPLVSAFRSEMEHPNADNRSLRLLLVNAMASLGTTSTVPVLIDAMADKGLREAAIRGVVRFGKEAVPFLTFILLSEDRTRESAVAEAMIRIGRAASMDIAKLLKHPSRRVREIGISLLTIVGDEESAPLIREALVREKEVSESELIQSLRLYYFSMREAFMAALAEGNRESRTIALKTILNMKDLDAVPNVERVLDAERDPAVRLLACKVLWYLDAPGTRKRLLDLIQYESPELKIEALRAIRLLLPPDALVQVASLLKGEARDVKKEAERTILRMTGLAGLDTPAKISDWVDAWKKRVAYTPPKPDAEGNVMLGGGATLHYAVYGSSGPWLVVVPGGPDMPHEYLTRWFQPLARAFRVVLYDPRGRGASKDPSALALYDVTSEAGDLQELFIHLKADKVNVLGHGFGNLVVLRLLQHDSGRVRRVVLSGPPVPVGKDVLAALSRLPERLDGVWRDDYLFVERNGSKFHPTVRNRLLDQALLHAYFMNPEWLPLLPDLHGDPLMRHRLLQAIRGLDLREVLDKSQTPLLVIVSKADVYPEDTLKWYVDLAGRNKAVHLTTFGNSGHFPFIEENGRFTDTVRDFLQ